MENSQAMMMVSSWAAALLSDTDLPFQQQRAHQEGQRAQPYARQPSVEQEVVQRRNKLTGK
jgi:hypothetical protein